MLDVAHLLKTCSKISLEASKITIPFRVGSSAVDIILVYGTRLAHDASLVLFVLLVAAADSILFGNILQLLLLHFHSFIFWTLSVLGHFFFLLLHSRIA